MTGSEHSLDFPNLDDFMPEPEETAPEVPGTDDATPPTQTLGRFLVDATLDAATRRRLLSTSSLAAVVQVPTPAWVEPVRGALKAMARWDHIVARDGSERTGHRPDKGNDWITSALSRGGRVVGIAAMPDQHLPSALMSSADLRITIRPPSPSVLRRAIKAATGTMPRRLPGGLEFLDFPELCAAIRTKTTARSCVRRLQAMARARSRGGSSLAEVPPLAALHGYGQAMDWGIALIRDLEAWRQGRIPFESVDSRIVLASDPGLGKTSFVRSLAKSAGLPLVETSVAAWFANSPGFLDSVLKEAQRVFVEAAALAAASPARCAIVHLDEIDAIPDRRALTDRDRAWWATFVSFLLVLLDANAASPANRLVVIGSTNHASRLDPALIRPGRLNRVVEITRPDEAALVGIMRQHLDGDLIDEDLYPLAALGVGATGAEVTSWVSRARQTARVAERPMILADLLAEVAPEEMRSSTEVWQVAVHEASHAVVCAMTGAATVRAVSIVSRNGIGGHVMTEAAERLLSREGAERRVMVALAGHAGETEICGRPTAGAAADLAAATMVLTDVHGVLGLGGSLLHRRMPETSGSLVLTDPEIRKAVEQDLDRLYAATTMMIREHRPLVEAIARVLVAERQLGADDFMRIVDTYLRARAAAADAQLQEAAHG